MKTLRRTLISAILFVVFAHQARAEQFTIGSGDWFNAANWDDGFGNHTVPDASSQPLVRIRDGHSITISSGEARTQNELTVGHTTNGTLTLSGGDLFPGQRIHVGNSGSQGVLNVNSPDSQLGCGVIFIGRQISSIGTLNLSAGVVATTAGGSVFIGGTGSHGIVNMTGGNLAAANFQIGQDGGSAEITHSSGFIGSTAGSENNISNATIALSGDAEWQLGNDMDFGGGTLTMVGDSTFEVQGRATIRNVALSLADTTDFHALGNAQFVGSNATATLTMTGGLLETDNALVLSELDPLTVNVSGGEITAHHSAFFANGIDSEVNAVFTGGTFNIPGDLGQTAGRGQLVVGTQGLATVTMRGTTLLDADGTAFVGGFAEGDGLLIFDEDVVATIGGGTHVGSLGTGELRMAGNSRLTSVDEFFVGQAAGSTGHFEMTGGTLNVTKVTTTGGDLVVGLNSDAATAAIGPGIVTCTEFFVGANNGSDGLLTLRDGADITVASLFVVGSQAGSGGELQMLGGRVEVLGTAGDFRVGSAGAGTADIRGTSQIIAGDDIIVGLSTGSFGNLVLGGSASLSCGDDFKMASDANDSGGGLVMREDAVITVGDSMLIADNSLAGVSIDLDGNAVINVANDLVLGDNPSINLQVRLGETGGNPRITVADIINFPRFNCDNSTITVTMAGGTIEGRSLFIGDSGTEGTTLTFDMSGGTLRANGGFISIEGKGTTFTLTGGIIEGSAVNGLGIGSDFHFNGVFTMSQSGGLMTSPQNLSMFRFSQANGTFTLSGNGQIAVDGDFLLGDATCNSSFLQLGGIVGITGDSTLNDVTHELSGGVFESTGDYILQGPVFVEGFQLQDAAILEHTGGTLIVDGQFKNDTDGDHRFSGGSLTRSTAGVIDYRGPFLFKSDATVILEDDKTLTVSGTFTSQDLPALGGNFDGGGRLDLSGRTIEVLSGQTVRIPLIQVNGSTANLLSDTALDEIAIDNLVTIGGYTRISEAAFESGSFTGRAFALCEGAGMGGVEGDGVIGLAFSNNNPQIAPIANPDTIFRLPGQPVSEAVATLLANDTAENGGVVSLVGIVLTSANGQPVSHDGVTVTYSPNPAFNDPDTFLYTITNGDARADGIVTVIVVQPGDDQDNDGMDNAYELEHFGSVTGGDPANDTDKDGKLDGEEFIALTNPNDPSDLFDAEIELDPTGPMVCVQTHPGRIYQLHSSPDLTGFNPVGPAVIGDGTVKKLTDPTDPPGPFFQVTVSLQP